ncbi:hypothetical protein [Negativibacillus massiliensis]|uniref:hypothetical protein n=1 Tax=Negativibacillus massiliensis TaxID=1871035 RepID=UPI003AF9FA7F
MKKVLSVAMASAMVLGMGANAFAISYSTGSNEKADWPENFQFDGSLFVTDKDGNLVEEATTELNDNETVDFEPGDVIWMPLYADDQVKYDYVYNEGDEELDAVTGVKVATEDDVTVSQAKNKYKLVNGKWLDASGNDVTARLDGYYPTTENETFLHYPAKVTLPTLSLKGTDYADRDMVKGSERYYVGTERVSEEEFKAAMALGKDGYITVNVAGVEGTDDSASKPINSGNVVDYGHYTGNIDKNWSINLIEKSTAVGELIEKAELYKATVTDVASYSRYGADIETNAVFLKITLKDEWKTTTSETLKYYVYVANNNNKAQQTNEVWVSGTYANTDVREVSFDWTNDASKPGLWKVKEGNGVAVFDFADKAFFSVKMYEGETMYLDLGTAYDKAIAGEMDAEADSFYKFDNTNANFARTGELLIVSDDSSLVPYEIDADGNFVKVDAEYVENYAVAHTNQKVNGFVFNTKQLGNYVLSTEELGEEEEVTEEPTTEEPVVEEPVVEETNKPNPNTGAEDFVGLAVSLAVVSVAAAGALALKK